MIFIKVLTDNLSDYINIVHENTKDIKNNVEMLKDCWPTNSKSELIKVNERIQINNNYTSKYIYCIAIMISNEC